MLLDSNIASINKDGGLIIDMRPMLDSQCLLSSWHDGIDYYIKTQQQWENESSDPGFILITKEHLNPEVSPVSDYLKPIPQWLLTSLSIFSYKQFSILKFLSLVPSLQDIFKHSPTLFWLSIVCSVKQSSEPNKTVELLQSKREKVVAQLIGRQSKSLVKFIQKITLFEGSHLEYQCIMDCLANDETIKDFAHWKSIPIQALAVYEKYPELLKTTLMQHLIEEDQPMLQQQIKFGSFARVLQDIDRMVEQLGLHYPTPYFHQIDTKQKLDDTHDELVRRFNQQFNAVQPIRQLRAGQYGAINRRNNEFNIINQQEKDIRKESVVFPKSPLKDNEDIKQLMCSDELLLEGQEMHHCVGSYVKEARDGGSYFYKVTKPERCTLQIQIKGNKVYIQGFRLACNKIPSEDSSWAIRNWIDEQS